MRPFMRLLMSLALATLVLSTSNAEMPPIPTNEGSEAVHHKGRSTLSCHTTIRHLSLLAV